MCVGIAFVLCESRACVLGSWLKFSAHLWYEHKAQCDRSAEDDEHSGDGERGVLIASCHGGYGDAYGGQNHHVVHGHAYMRKNVLLIRTT